MENMDSAGLPVIVFSEDWQTHCDIARASNVCVCVLRAFNVCVGVCVYKSPFVCWVSGTVELDSHRVELVNGLYRVEFRRVEKVIRAGWQAVAFSEGSNHRSQVSVRPDITAGQ